MMGILFIYIYLFKGCAVLVIDSVLWYGMLSELGLRQLTYFFYSKKSIRRNWKLFF